MARRGVTEATDAPEGGRAPRELPAGLTGGERRQLEAEMELEEATRALTEARAQLRAATRRWRVAVARTGRRVRRVGPAARSGLSERALRVGTRILLVAVAFCPLVVSLLPEQWGQGAVRDLMAQFALVAIAFAFLRLCPHFDEELRADSRARYLHALVGVALGAAFAVGRVLIDDFGGWGATEGYRSLAQRLTDIRLGPVVGLAEALPLFVMAGAIQAIVYGGMLRWVVTRPRGPLPSWAGVVLCGVAFAWFQLCVPDLGDWRFAAVGLLNGLVVACATWLTASPVLGGAFLGVQWWVCLAAIYWHVL